MNFKTLVNFLEEQKMFKSTSKKKAFYQFKNFQTLSEDVILKKGMSYQDVVNIALKKLKPYQFTIALSEFKVITITSDNRVETDNVANSGDYVFCGTSNELYVLSPEKIKKFYKQIDQDLSVDLSNIRMVAKMSKDFWLNLQLPEVIKFEAPWKSEMILTAEDYLVKESEGKYYRIGKKEYEDSYNQPGIVEQ